jgi:phosphoribosylanthranilate isomerase
MAPRVPKIKFCGLTSLPDAEAAVAAGAWAIGLNFWPGSPRRCERAVAAEIAAALKRRVEVVGVFVNATLDELAATADAVGLTMLQLHGDEGPAYSAEAARRTGCKVIKAVRVRSRADIQALAPFHTDFHLLDSYTPGVPGGTGATFAWEIARSHRGPVPVILSGGLTPDNVAEAIAISRPFAVDVASGVELSPGRKDPVKLEAFSNAVAGAHAPQPGGAPARPRSWMTRAPRDQARPDAERAARPSAHVRTRTPL